MKAHEKAFVDAIAPIVIQKCIEHNWGIPSAIIGQACVESVKDKSLSGLATTCNNFYGMKWTSGCGCDYKAYSTNEQRPDGSYYTVVSKFRKYLDYESGIEGYFRFIEGYKRYKPVMSAKNYTEYATQLKLCGWATSINYTNSIINRVKANGLTVYDSMMDLPVVPEYVVGKTYTTYSDLNIREQPFGTKMKFECITENAKQNAKFDDFGQAILKKGTRVTCKAIKKLTNSTWILIPSGWICAVEAEKIYIK